jgi:glycerol-3-phosphate dehydrogenase (NAD+)
LRVNTSNDVVGVELSGALKNVLAIAAGMIEGLELGNNALAAVVAQGCAEIRWLATKMGAKPETLSGLSGTGDIMLTCFVPLRRVLIISTPVPVRPRSRCERRSLRS